MASKVRHIDFSPDEYIAGVAGQLSAEEQGVYWMICSLIMSHGGNVENDPQRIGRLVCLGSAKTRNIIKKLISSGKIQEKFGKIYQKRAENEVKKAKKRIEIARKNGAAHKKNKHLTEPVAYSPASLSQSSSQSSSQSLKKNSNSSKDNGGRIDEGKVGNLKPETYEQAQETAPGFDIYFIEAQWRNGGYAAKARNPDSAFLGFVKRHKKENPL